ncbi:SigB/SigF/SigG family RNA polymerase sigma factor [Solirubrobacter phytolaccae]|uniref:SigB/SigF/SigG family RNA polymerase sigma factor n=1 Tax=Solirubrobacter phytolaccae TaxID=1404360 RepID=A0A9X3NEV6_9ACTN|nr:SigB/SigF/SigG family RNA polymerase sigma factor [Solirubrobacter phytolaccae]MDA0183660.1 SigB/SigF/SigG family RNA polymerase sigma factor [Solirubrobacter phytolaccae]
MPSVTMVHPAVRREPERELFARLRAGDEEAREAILHRFLPLAYKLARGYHGGAEADDLDQVAAIGLLKAIDRFDATRGLAFSTYAFPTIVGELKRYFRDRAWSVRVPRSVQELALRVERGSTDLTATLGRTPTVAELAQHTDSTPEQVLDALRTGSARRADSLDRPRGDGDSDLTVGDRLPFEDPSFACVEDGLVLNDLLRQLRPRDRQIVTLRFREDLSQSQIARRVGLSQMQVSRTLRDALAQLRDAAEAVS